MKTGSTGCVCQSTVWQHGSFVCDGSVYNTARVKRFQEKEAAALQSSVFVSFWEENNNTCCCCFL